MHSSKATHYDKAKIWETRVETPRRHSMGIWPMSDKHLLSSDPLTIT